MIRWSVEPLVPPSLWLALAVAGACLLGWYMVRRPSMISRTRWSFVIALMFVAFALVLVLLLNPTRVTQIPPPAGKPLLTILVDSSASMGTVDVRGQTRYSAAARTALDLSRQLSDRFDLRVRTFAANAASVDVKDLPARKPGGHSTDVAAAIISCLDEERPQGQAVALLSDGAHNAAPAITVLDAARLARAMGAPIYTKTFGGDAGGFDLGIELRSAQDLAFLEQKVLVTARITHVGLIGSHPDVQLIRDGKEIARQQASIDGPQPAEVHFWITGEKTGVFPYELRVTPLPGELTQANNAASYLLRVIDEPIRILQVEGKPYWDSKFLLRTLSEVPAVELESAVRVTDGRIMCRTISRPDAPATQPQVNAAAASQEPQGVRIEKWKIINDAATVLGDAQSLSRYQIIVIGRDAEPFLTEQAVTNLQSWVTRNGGALICYRGSPTSQNSEQLARLLPVKWTPGRESRFHVQMTSQGRDLHWLADAGAGVDEDDSLPRLPTLASAAQPQRSKPLAVVLARSISATSEESPAVVYQPYGSGRVVVIEGSGMWRWAFLPPQYQKQQEVYDALWHSMLRWLVGGSGLMPGQKLTLRSQKLSFGTEENAVAVLQVREESLKGSVPSVLLSSDGGGQEQTFAPVALPDEPGVYRIDFGKLAEGTYHVRVAGIEESFGRTVFDVRNFGEEELNFSARPDLMRRISEDTGGAALENDPVAELSARFAEHMQRSRPSRTDRATAWDRWWVLMIVIVAWTASWWLRRSAGLV